MSNIPPAARAADKKRWLSLGAALVLSIGVHAIALAVVASVVWRIALPGLPDTKEEPDVADVFLVTAPPPPPPPPPVVAQARPPEKKPVASPEAVEKAAPVRAPVATTAAPVAVPAPRLATPVQPASPQPAPARASLPSAAPAPIGVAFAGLSAERARSVVYVVDTSGQMVTTLPLVLAELRRSVAGLVPPQRFGVVLFSEPPGAQSGTPTARAFAGELVDAGPKEQARLRTWLAAAQAGGRSNVIEGLRAAMALEPQVIFLLSRAIVRTGGGQWELGVERTLAELDRLNPIDPATGRRGTVIKTIQFLEDDPTGLMQAIAARHGTAAVMGTANTKARAPAIEDYRVMSAEDLAR